MEKGRSFTLLPAPGIVGAAARHGGRHGDGRAVPAPHGRAAAVGSAAGPGGCRAARVGTGEAEAEAGRTAGRSAVPGGRWAPGCPLSGCLTSRPGFAGWLVLKGTVRTQDAGFPCTPYSFAVVMLPARAFCACTAFTI